MTKITEHPIFKLLGKRVTGIKTGNFDGQKCDEVEITFSGGGKVVMSSDWDDGWHPFLVRVELGKPRKKPASKQFDDGGKL